MAITIEWFGTVLFDFRRFAPAPVIGIGLHLQSPGLEVDAYHIQADFRVVDGAGNFFAIRSLVEVDGVATIIAGEE